MAAASDPAFKLDNHIYGTIYGNCAGDAIGLLTEFMVKDEAKKHYGKFKKKLEYEHKMEVDDIHRERWAVGDWTDDSDQMILIMESIVEKDGQVDPIDYAVRILKWSRKGFPELNDFVGMGIGDTTKKVLSHRDYLTDPHQAAKDVWEGKQRNVAPNGGVMRTSVLGIHQYTDIDKVVENTLNICKTTHADPRCQASCVAVTTAIAFMLRRDKRHLDKKGKYNEATIMEDSFQLAKECLPEESMVSELKQHMFAKSLSTLKLDEAKKIGYTYKCLGAGFWSFRQDDFRKALEKVVFAGGDADTNCAVAGALLGCKLGCDNIPTTWVQGLKHKDWLDQRILRFLEVTRRPESSTAGEPETIKKEEEK